VNKQRFILGGGGHAKVLIELLYQCGERIDGVIEPAREIGEELFGSVVLGADSVIDEYDPDTVELINGVGQLPGDDRRRKLFSLFVNKGFQFRTLIHPSAVVSSDAVLGEGVQIMAGCVLQSSVIVGENTIINTRSIVDHDCRVGRNSHIAPGVILCGGVNIGESVYLGAGATVIQNISIASNSIVGAGTLVVNSFNSELKITQPRKNKVVRLSSKEIT